MPLRRYIILSPRSRGRRQATAENHLPVRLARETGNTGHARVQWATLYRPLPQEASAALDGDAVDQDQISASESSTSCASSARIVLSVVTAPSKRKGMLPFPETKSLYSPAGTSSSATPRSSVTLR